ncbi:uncharacterized protein LOC111366700 [Olea europaea var. sylvestris]|uniref:uncharacterized protein LOC111366700 n=1 Tax=Olea europaea var. sylvestris TaxID=158386 RepID=UPI000C1D88D1|nr:uncharacterized protein LOC111366700 [Olea europaea var. sylvestris]
MFFTHGLSISSLRGQSYDGASNMSSEFNGLKSLILRENPCAMHVHCFAHQLQLAVVSVAHRNVMLSDLFKMLAIIVNLVGASCKRVDALRTSYHSEILERLNIEELSGGTGQFQEMSMARLGDTRRGSHLKTVTHFINDLSQALQKKDQDIQNAMRLLKLCKYALQNMRDNGWDTLLSKEIEFCVDKHISVPNMDDIKQPTTELFTCISCLSPRDSFAAFDKLVETGGSCCFLLVYRLITLILILPVAIASVERIFSAINLIKNDLRNKMGDELLNDNLVVYMEKYLFMKLENEIILQHFQNMRPRRIQLSKLTITE